MTFEYYYTTYFTPLAFYASKMTGNADSAKDVVQDVFIRTWKQNIDFSVETQVKNYLYTGVRRACLNFLERRRFDSLERAYYVEADTLDFVKIDFYTRLFDIVKYLPPECRTVIILYYREGYNSNEIAKMLGLAPSTVKNQMMRGAKLLRELVEKGRPVPKVINALNSIAYTLRKVRGYKAREVSEMTGISISQLATRITQLEKAVADYKESR